MFESDTELRGALGHQDDASHPASRKPRMGVFGTDCLGYRDSTNPRMSSSEPSLLAEEALNK